MYSLLSLQSALPCWRGEKFSIDCFSLTPPSTSPWKLLVQTEEQQCQSTATFPPSPLAGGLPHTPSTLPSLQVLQAQGAQASAAAPPLLSCNVNHATGIQRAGAMAAASVASL